MNQYLWGSINKAQSVYFACHTYLKYNSGKPACTASGHFKLPGGLLKF